MLVTTNNVGYRVKVESLLHSWVSNINRVLQGPEKVKQNLPVAFIIPV